MKTLHAHQELAIVMLRDALKIGSKRPLLNLPTGAGKTVIAAEIVKSALSKKKRVIFTVPFISLVDQTVERFWEHGIRNIGVIQSNHPMTAPDRPVQIASIQTLARRTIPKADLVLIDECHLNFKHIAQWMEDWYDVPFIGLSATPGTRGLGRLYDKLICPIGMNELIDKGFLSKYRAFAPSHPDLSQVKTVAGDYHEGQLSDVMKKLTGDVVQTWLERGSPDKTLVFAVDRAHAKHLQERFEAHGIRAGYVDALTTPADWEVLKKSFHLGETKVVCSVGTMIAGIDWDVRCISFSRPTKSPMLLVQAIGRGLRTADGKSELILLDHTDTVVNLGLPSDIRFDRLCDGKMALGSEVEKKPPLPKCCPSCSALKPPGVRKCPSCGFEPAVKAAGVETVEGELIELTGRKKAAAKDNREATWSEKVQFIGELKLYAQRTGKSEGWIAHKYKAKFGVFPNDPRVKYAPAASSLSAQVDSWIRAQNIRWIKSQEAQRRRA